MLKLKKMKINLIPFENKLNNIDNTIDTKIGNYLEDPTKTQSLDVRFNTVNRF